MTNFEHFSFAVLADNGIFEIYRGSDGRLHIRWILPDPPQDLVGELRAVAGVLNEASRMENRATAEQLRQFAENLLNARAQELNVLMTRPGETALAS